MSDATGLADAMLGLPGFRVLAVDATPAEVVIQIETSAIRVGCPACGVVATAHDRMPVEYRDLAAFGRPARLVWAKRRWRCGESLCATKNLERGVHRVLLAMSFDEASGGRVLPPSRPQCPPGEPDGR